MITELDGPEGNDGGDAFVVAPDDGRAGIVWPTGLAEMEVVLAPDDGRWGVYGVPISRPVRTPAERMAELAAWLPALRRRHAAWADRPSHPTTTRPASNVEP